MSTDSATAALPHPQDFSSPSPVAGPVGQTKRVSDTIFIRSLAVSSRIGATAAERAFPQRLLLDFEIVPLVSFDRMADALEATVDYAAVSQEIRALCAEGECNLLETLAVNCADHILTSHPARQVVVRIRKFILPETEYVAVEYCKTRGMAPSLDGIPHA